MIHHGDLFDVLPTLAECSVDACVTDPPYGIGFMGKEWDTFKPSVAAQKQGLRQINKSEHYTRKAKRLINPNLKGRTVDGAVSSSQIDYDRTLGGQRGFQGWTERWAREVLRVLKPGGYLLVCGAPRSFHRMACGIEDAGFEIRDCLSWLYGQGFPKSLNLGDGRGTALKPSWEPIILARKPLKGAVALNVEQYSTGALNIDACRIDGNGRPLRVLDAKPTNSNVYEGRLAGDERFMGGSKAAGVTDLGRWPADVLLDEAAAAMLDEQTGELTSGFMAKGTPRRPDETTRNAYGVFSGTAALRPTYADSGGASRFYYVAKPSREERDFGCDGLPVRSGGEATDRKDGSAGTNSPRAGACRTGGARNFHPTVKPVELMRWLVRLVTPPDGIVLDPFAGSGTTAMACRYEHRRYILIEREAEYVEIAKRRVAAVAPLFSAEAGAL